VGAGASVGAVVAVGGSGAPPHAARMTASKRIVPRSTRLFFIDICNILLSMGIVTRAFMYFDGGHLLTNIKVLSGLLISPLY
jgi:hypothetical protein